MASKMPQKLFIPGSTVTSVVTWEGAMLLAVRDKHKSAKLTFQWWSCASGLNNPFSPLQIPRHSA